MSPSSTAAAFEKELRRKARETGTPLIGGFELTGRCNFDCKMCYVHTMDNEYARAHELSTEQWIQIMDAAYDEGMLYAVISGGECLLRPDFEEIYLNLFNKGGRVSVLPNGSLLTDEYIDFFSKYKPRQLQISLYGSSNDVYERVTGSRSYDKIRKVLKALLEQKINLRVAVTPNRFLLDDVENIITFLEKSKIDYAVNPYLIAPREGITRDGFEINESEILEVLRILNQARGKTSVPVDPNGIPKAGGSCETVINGMECSAGVFRFAITWDGYMVPCVSITSPRINVVEDGFHKSWLAIRENDKKTVQARECIECPYKSVCVKCPVIRYKDLYCGHCNEDICHLTVSKVQAGITKWK